jgi:hypothetical protein
MGDRSLDNKGSQRADANFENGTQLCELEALVRNEITNHSHNTTDFHSEFFRGKQL